MLKNDLRKTFEAIPEIKKEISDMKLVFNKKINGYGDLGGKYVERANWINGAWFMFKQVNKDCN